MPNENSKSREERHLEKVSRQIRESRRANGAKIEPTPVFDETPPTPQAERGEEKELLSAVIDSNAFYTDTDGIIVDNQGNRVDLAFFKDEVDGSPQ